MSGQFTGAACRTWKNETTQTLKLHFGTLYWDKWTLFKYFMVHSRQLMTGQLPYIYRLVKIMKYSVFNIENKFKIKLKLDHFSLYCESRQNTSIYMLFFNSFRVKKHLESLG